MKQPNDERGSAMFSALILVGTLLVLTLAFLRIGQQVTSEQTSAMENARAAYLAESGISEALEALRSGKSGNIGTGDDPAYLGGGVVWVEATDLGGGRTQLDSAAMKDAGRAALRVVVEDAAGAGGGGPGGSGSDDAFFTMLFSNKHLQLDQDVMIDSWDSSLGAYLVQATNLMAPFLYAGDEGGAASNSTIQLDSDAHVFGDVHVGPGQSLSMAANAYVSGSTTPSASTVTLAPITVPAIASSGAYSVGNNQTKTINPGSYHFTSVTQGKFSKLKIIGPATIVMDGYTTGTTATLEVDCTNGPVYVYDTGVWSVDKNYTLGPALGTPVDASFLISSTGTVEFDQGSKISFGFYCPTSRIEVDQSAEVWGALVADEIEIDQGTHFHFDENLKGFSLPWKVPGSVLGISGSSAPEIVSWTKIDFPVDAWKGDRRSPFSVMKLEKAALRSPADAWE